MRLYRCLNVRVFCCYCCLICFLFKFFSESINEKIHVIISGDAENWDKIQPPSLKKKKKTWKGRDGKHIFQKNRDYMTYSQHTLMERENINVLIH